MEFRGALEFASDPALEAALDGIEESGSSSLFHAEDLRVSGLRVEVSFDGSAPASMWEPSLVALGELAQHATEGSISAAFFGDQAERWSARAGKRRSAKAAHGRWRLFFAAQAGDADAARDAIGSGVGCDAPLDRHGRRALHVACARGHTACVKALLELGADADATDAAQRTPMDVARSVDIVELLRKHGAREPDRAALDAQLVRACAHREWELARSLIARGATGGAQRDVPVGRALVNGRADVWDALAAAGGDMAAAVTSHFGGSVEWSAALGLGGSVVLLHRVRALGLEIDLPALVSSAARNERLELLTAALEEPGAVDACGDGTDPAHAMCVAAAGGCTSSMELLRARGVPLHPASREWETCPLFVAAGSSAAAVAWLLDRGVPIDARNVDGETALFSARWGPADAVVELVARGLDPNGTDARGVAPWDSGVRADIVKKISAALEARGLSVPRKRARKK